MTSATRQTDGDTGSVTLSDRDRHRLLADERRRLLLDVLGDRRGPPDVHELARAVAARERGTDDLDEAVVRDVTVALHHHHLPMLDDLGVVDYDHESRRVG